ncbi:unnamed protein product [Urochloa humidicola]
MEIKRPRCHPHPAPSSCSLLRRPRAQALPLHREEGDGGGGEVAERRGAAQCLSSHRGRGASFPPPWILPAAGRTLRLLCDGGGGSMSGLDLPSPVAAADPWPAAGLKAGGGSRGRQQRGCMAGLDLRGGRGLRRSVSICVARKSSGRAPQRSASRRRRAGAAMRLGSAAVCPDWWETGWWETGHASGGI